MAMHVPPPPEPQAQTSPATCDQLAALWTLSTASCVQFGYVVYPPEGPRPPIGEEFNELVRRNKAAKEAKEAAKSQ